MKTFQFAFILALTSAPLFAVEHLRGTLEKNGTDFAISSGGRTLKIVTTKKVLSSLPSLEAPTYVNPSNGMKYAFEFKGEARDGEFHLEEVPVNVPGVSTMTGTLDFDQADNRYSINGKTVSYGYTKVLNGYQFDEKSQRSFIGKKVYAEGYLDEKGTFILQALTPSDLFAASLPQEAPSAIQSKLAKLGPKDFILKEVVKNEISQGNESFRVTVAADRRAVEPGDGALIITLSGRQGDSFGSVNGHMVAGLGEVQPDMTLRAEVSNAYVTNDKDILSGNTSLTNYFSHIVQGQNNYRPTYTLIAYGVSKKKLKQFRDALEGSHIKFRTTKLGITPQFNCTTETVKALKNAGIKGKYQQLDNFLKGVVTLPLAVMGNTPNTIHFSLGNDASRFHPRGAYNSFVAAFLKEEFRKKHGIKRVDFAFYPQTPSNRPVGGIALGNIMKATKFKKLHETYEVNEKTKLSAEKLRPILEEKLRDVP